MIRFLSLASALLILGACSGGGQTAEAVDEDGSLRIVGTAFELTTEDGTVLRSPDLVGATFEMNVEGGTAMVRIDAVTPDAARPSVLLHTFSVIDPASGAASPLCDPDAYGQRTGFPVTGRFENDGRFNADPAEWLLTCTSGSQGKCVLWGYDPWGKGPNGESLVPHYEACQRVARADYDGSGEAHTRDGTQIDIWDSAGVQVPTVESGYLFEAGWGPEGAVCVARTRWPDLLTVEDLHAARPDLAGECTEATARAKGAVMFTAVKPR